MTNKSLGGPTRFSSWMVCITLMSAFPAYSFDTEDLKAIRDAGEELRESSVATPIDNIHYREAHGSAQALLKELQQTDPTLRKMAELSEQKTQASYQTLLFASQSLGAQGMLEAMQSIAGDEKAVIVLRGVPEGMNLADGIMHVQKLTKSVSPTPNIIIDPTLFKKHNIKTVPTIVVITREDGQAEAQLARVSGITSADWLKRNIEGGRTGDLGIQGPVQEIAEPDFIEVAQQKIRETDWEKKKEQAITRFWEKQTFQELPKAKKARTRTINPEIVVTENILAPNGAVIAFQGQRINPLEQRPFTQALLIFDPTDQEQLGIIAEMGPALLQRPGVARLTYIATSFDREEGWDSYKAATDRLDSPVYLLTPDVETRFKLEFVPSVVTAVGKSFVVEELISKSGE